jgi:hypothetical protein
MGAECAGIEEVLLGGSRKALHLHELSVPYTPVTRGMAIFHVLVKFEDFIYTLCVA